MSATGTAIASDSVIERNRAARWMVFIIISLLTALLPALLGSKFGWWGAIPGLSLGIFATFWLMRFFTVTVPQVQAYVTVDNLRSLLGFGGNPNVIYGPGWHVSYPWESRGEKSNLSLEILTIKFSEDVPGKDTQLKSTGALQFQVDLTLADHFVGVDESTINGGLVELIKAEISGLLATMTADEAKSGLKDINKNLTQSFAGGKKSKTVTKFEQQYGIRVISLVLSGVDLPESVQKGRDALDKANQVFKGVSAMLGVEPSELKKRLENGAITIEQYNDTLDRFAAQSGTATMNINAFKISGGVKGLERLIEKFFGGGKK